MWFSMKYTFEIFYYIYLKILCLFENIVCDLADVFVLMCFESDGVVIIKELIFASYCKTRFFLWNTIFV